MTGHSSLSSEEQHATLVLLNDEIRQRLEVKRSALERVDTKATLILGFAAIAAQFLAARSDAQPGLSAAALTLYGVSAVFGVLVIWVRPHEEAPDPQALVDGYGDRQVDDVLGVLVGTRASTFASHQAINKSKVFCWKASLVALSVGLVISVVSISVGGS